MKNAKIKKCQKGEVVLKQGEYNKTLYKVLSGTVALYLNYGKRNQYLIETLSFPHCFGEMNILIGYPSYYTVVALEDTVVLRVPAEQFPEFIRNNDSNAFLLMQTMAKSLYSMDILLRKIESGDYPAREADLPGEPIPESQVNIFEGPIEEFHPADAEEISGIVRRVLDKEHPTRFMDEKIKEIKHRLQAQKPLLPCAQLYLPGHKGYPNVTHPEYREYLFRKDYTCPHCGEIFEGRRISYTKLVADPIQSKDMRYDFHIFYKDFQAEWYDIVTCPHCYFSALVEVFLNPKYLQKDVYEQKLEEISAQLPLDLYVERSLDTVFAQHYLALVCAPGVSDHYQSKACIWMNLCWLYRSVEDREMVHLAEDQTVEAYQEMYEHCGLTPEQEQRTCLTIAGILFDRGNFEEARNWAFTAKVNGDGKVIYRNLAQGLIDDCRVLIEKQKAEERKKERQGK